MQPTLIAGLHRRPDRNGERVTGPEVHGCHRLQAADLRRAGCPEASISTSQTRPPSLIGR
jgi:hypothetical protein